MAAPDSAYQLYIVEGRDSLNATFVQRLAIPIDEATFLTRFKLDKKIEIALPGGLAGWIGMCLVGGTNYNYHAAARRGCINESPGGGDYLAMIDGGLNIKGDATNPTTAKRLFTDIEFNAHWFSAYYAATTAYGIDWYTTGDVSVNGVLNLGALAAAASDTSDTDYPLAGDLSAVEPGDVLHYRSFVTNEEGTHYSAWQLAVLVKPLTVKRAATSGPSDTPYAACLLDGAPEFTVYIDRDDIDLGAGVYQDQNRLVAALNGSYRYPNVSVGGYKYFYFHNGVVVSNKVCPQFIIISVYGEMVDMGSGLTHFTVNIQANFLPNTSMMVSGELRIYTGGGLFTAYGFEHEMLATTDLQTFALEDELGNAIEYTDPDSINITSVILEYEYYENIALGNEAVYEAQFS